MAFNEFSMPLLPLFAIICRIYSAFIGIIAFNVHLRNLEVYTLQTVKSRHYVH